MASQDDFFGPRLPGSFDFTILFEQIVLSLVPTALLIIATPIIILQLTRHGLPHKQSRALLIAKLTAVFTYFALQVAVLVLWSQSVMPKTKACIPVAVINIFGAVTVAMLSYFQHVRSEKPSLYLNGYLFLSAILDIAQNRTLWIRPNMLALAAVSAVALVAKLMLLFLEEVPKNNVRVNTKIANEALVGIFSRGLFCWLNSLFLTGIKSLLSAHDINGISDKLDSQRLLAALEKNWKIDPKSSRFALLRCTFSTYRWQFIAGILPRLLFSGFTFAQPFLISSIVHYVNKPIESRSKNVTAGLVGATILVYTGLAVTGAWYKHMTYQLLTMYRGGLASLVFQKTLKLKTFSIRESAPVTLMSTDIESIVLAGDPLHDIWASFLELPIAIYLLYQHIGFPSLFIVVPGILTSTATTMISPALGPARVKWNQAIQERVGSASTFLSHVKAIKIMALSGYFHQQLHNLRTEELRQSRQFRWIMAQIQSIGIASHELTPVVIIIAAIFWTKASQGLTVAQAFTSLSIISIASAPLIHILVSIMSIFGAIGSFSRLQSFLLSVEHYDSRQTSTGSQKVDPPTLINSCPSSLDMSTTLTSDLPHAVANFELQDKKGSSVASDILNAVEIKNATFVIGDDQVEVLHNISLNILQGTLTMVVGRVGCGKTSLLKALAGELSPINGHIQSNHKSVGYCEQAPWLQNITVRDNIIGQSNYDEKWLSVVIDACALDEDLLTLPHGDLTHVGSRGVALSGGQKQRVALARAVYSRKKILILDDVFSGLDHRTSRTVFQKLLGSGGLLRKDNCTVILSTNHVDFLPAADYITMLDMGHITRNQAAYDSFEPSDWGVYPGVTDNNEDQPSGGDELSNKLSKRAKMSGTESTAEKQNEEDMGRQTGDFDCYKIYFRSMGVMTLTMIVTLAVLHVVLSKMTSILLKLWTERGTGPRDFAFMGGYLGLAVGAVVTGSGCFVFYFLVGVPRSSKWLHQLLLESVTRAPLQFFTTTDSGITLNRFSQDMTLIDNALPMALLGVILLVLSVIAETGIIAAGSSYVGAVIPVCAVALYIIQRFYLRTSRQIRYLDLEMKSPLYTQFTETLAGLSTIRAFGWAASTLAENHRRLDMSQKPFYILFCIQRWLQVVLDLFVAGIAVVLVAFALNFPNSTSQGAIGLAMLNIVNFSQSLTHMITMWTRLETSLGAISRLKWFIHNTPNENRPEERETVPDQWPSKGCIELENVTASYSNETEPVLRNVSLIIQPGQKVAVCGRSGSGKSSLILAITRLIDFHEGGSIRIDNIDLSKVPRQDIRSRITSLPQDGLQLTGTLRHNLDPHGTIQADEPLVSVLQKTSLWPIVESRNGLDADMENLGFSAGQLQLLCLARALLRRDCPIILLDEATSSVDLHTDNEVRAAIASDLVGRTIIEVAHRLDVVRDYNLIVIVSEGELVEVGAPDDLLARNSIFKELWDSRGV